MAAAGVLQAQTVELQPAAGSLRPEWRKVGGYSFDLALASPATGPVDGIWFSADGERLYIRTGSGTYFESSDLERWRPQPGSLPPEPKRNLSLIVPALPEAGATVRAADSFYARLYAFGSQVYGSEDGGRRWRNLTGFRGQSIIGGGFKDLAVSPNDPDFVLAVNDYGVWRSADGGLTWSGLNDLLPNLPIRRIVSTPVGTQGTRILTSNGTLLEWSPGERQTWQPVADQLALQESSARRKAGIQLGTSITAIAFQKDYSYAGSADGRLWVSADGGASWHMSNSELGAPVVTLYALPDQPRTVFAAMASGRQGTGTGRVLRSLSGGLSWEDLTGDLPPGEVFGLAADGTGTALYVATSAGVYFDMLDSGLAAAGHWLPISQNLPSARPRDVRLDEAGDRLYVALEGYGIYATPAPHRVLRVDVVNSADFTRRPAAPGSLLTVLGDRLIKAQAGLMDAPVLHTADTESQIQVPFEITGNSTVLALDLARGRTSLQVPLEEVSPAIFIDPDGSGLLLDGASGVLLDTLHPARSASRVQVLATGLGRVRPAWPSGIAAPLDNPPVVVAPVRAFLDGAPVEVIRAALAPGYVGFYLIEIQLPSLVNAGPGELYLEAGGRQSNRVRIDLEP